MYKLDCRFFVRLYSNYLMFYTISGEEVAQYNGAYKVTKGLFAKYGGKRVVDTPITGIDYCSLSSLLSLLPPSCEI